MRKKPQVKREVNKPGRRRPISLAWALAASAALHGGLVFISPRPAPEEEIRFVELVPSAEPPSLAPTRKAIPPPPTVAEQSLELVPSQVVESERSGTDAIPSESRFWGERNQTVEKQTRAARIADFSAKKGEGAGGAGQSKVGADVSGELGEGGVGRPVESLTLKDFGVGGLEESVGGTDAATDDRLEGVAIGQRTALNTREFRYHSFYRRVKDQIRQTWKPEVTRRAQMLVATGGFPKKYELVTRVVAHLDSEGRVLSVKRLRSSGTEAIDQAAVSAFETIGNFPNPPTAMVDRDGQVRLHWEFILVADEVPRLELAQWNEREANERPSRRDL